MKRSDNDMKGLLRYCANNYPEANTSDPAGTQASPDHATNKAQRLFRTAGDSGSVVAELVTENTNPRGNGRIRNGLSVVPGREASSQSTAQVHCLFSQFDKD
jgi:hypothetical protein